jgi:hypothetical protein
LAKAGQYEQALEVASTIKDDYLKATAFVYLAAGLAETGKVADAVQVVSAIEQRDATPAIWFSQTVMVLTEAKQYNPALQMANAVTGENEKAWVLAQLANNLARSGTNGISFKSDHSSYGDCRSLLAHVNHRVGVSRNCQVWASAASCSDMTYKAILS